MPDQTEEERNEQAVYFFSGQSITSAPVQCHQSEGLAPVPLLTTRPPLCRHRWNVARRAMYWSISPEVMACDRWWIVAVSYNPTEFLRISCPREAGFAKWEERKLHQSALPNIEAVEPGGTRVARGRKLLRRS